MTRGTRGTILGFCATLALIPALAVAQSMSAGTPVQVSVGLNNSPADGGSNDVTLSPNSGILAFRSAASNLVPDDTNQTDDIFLRSASGTLTRESVSSAGAQADGYSYAPSLSQVTPSGAYGLVFLSRATNLVPGLSGQELQHAQVYLRLPHLKKTILISQAYAGSGFVGAVGTSRTAQVVALGDGDKFMVAFDSNAFNLVQNGVPAPNTPNGQRLSRIFIATVSVTKGEPLLAKMEVFTGLKGGQADGDIEQPVLNGFGDKLLFRTNAKNLGWSNPDGVYQIAAATKGGPLELVSKGNIDGAAGSRFSDSAAMSFDGSLYVFRTHAPNIFDGSPDHPSIVSYSPKTKLYTLINTNSLGERGNGTAYEHVRLDPKGRLLAFVDTSDNYLPAGADTNGREDIFVKDLENQRIVRVNVGAGGVQDTGDIRGGAVIGTLGYANQTATAGFYSSSSDLRQVAGGNYVEAYRSLITFSAPVLDTNTKIETPPDVSVSAKKLTLTFQKFGTGASVSSLDNVHNLATKASYEAQLTNSSTKKKLKVISTKNRVTLRNLTPGSYTIKYRVIGTTSKGKKITTKYSPTASATIVKS